jgi:hypothetical protein
MVHSRMANSRLLLDAHRAMCRFGRGALTRPMAHPMDSGLCVKVDSKEQLACPTPRMNGEAIGSCTSPI